MYSATQETAFLAAAQQALVYENSCFSQECGNWPDFRGRDGNLFRTSWCHGAPGVALARLGILRVSNDLAVRPGLEEALNTTAAFGPNGLDHLCCGHMGRVDVLLEASKRLGRPELRAVAETVAARVVRSAERFGGFRLFGNVSRTVYNPGLFQGVAGIGYGLLRLAVPKAYPALLLWD